MIEPFAGLREVPNVHMVVVHFPLALLPVALALDVFGALFRSRDLHVAARWCLWLGTLAAIAAAWTGEEGADDVHPYVTDAADALMDTHMDLQWGVTVAAVGLSLWRLVGGAVLERGRLVYLLVSTVMVATLLVAADLGGQMVFLHGVAVRVDADSLQGGATKRHEAAPAAGAATPERR